MKPLDSLFNLVHSLNENEKKYFRTHASRHVIGNKNNYEKLFDLYCELPADQPYDEADLKKLLRGKSYGKNLAVEKKNLYDLILEAMRIMQAYDSPENQLSITIEDTRFLTKKSLPHEANKEIEKGFKLATETENLSNYLLLHRLKSRIAEEENTEEGLLKIEGDFEQDKNILRLLNAERSLTYLRRKVSNLYMRGKLIPHMPELKKRLKESMDGISPSSPTVSCQLAYFTSNALIAETEREYEEGMKFCEQVLELIKNNTSKINVSNITEATLLTNYLVCAHHLERFDVFPGVLDRIEKIKPENIREEASLFQRTKSFRQLYHINVRSAGNTENLVKEIEGGLLKYGALISPREVINFRINMCMIYLFECNHSKLLGAVNKAYEAIERDEKADAYLILLKFFELIAHIGLKNHDTLSYQFDNVERWLREHSLKNDITAEILKALKNLNKGIKKEKIIGQLTEANCPNEFLMLRELVLRWLENPKI